jgi:hypothetical protein
VSSNGQAGLCSVESGDALHLSVEPVDKHLARSVLTGDHDDVVDRVVELRMNAELFSTSSARPGAVFLFDYVEEIPGHARNCGRRQPHCSGPEVPILPPGSVFAAQRVERTFELRSWLHQLAQLRLGGCLRGT